MLVQDTKTAMTKERYKVITGTDGDAETETCEFIIECLSHHEQVFAKSSNAARVRGDLEGSNDDAREAMAYQRAIAYVEDWKNSL